MLFQLTEEQMMIKQAARDFAVNECLPGVIERDELQKFPKEQIEKLADLGFISLVLQIFMPYQKYVRYLKWLTLALLAYVAVVFTVNVPWL